MPYYLRLSGEPFGIHYGYNPGYPASHGCIRVGKMRDAAYLFRVVPTGTTVTVEGSGANFKKGRRADPGALGERESLACQIGRKFKLCTRTCRVRLIESSEVDRVIVKGKTPPIEPLELGSLRAMPETEEAWRRYSGAFRNRSCGRRRSAYGLGERARLKAPLGLSESCRAALSAIRFRCADRGAVRHCFAPLERHFRPVPGLAQQRYVKSHRNLLRSPHSGPQSWYALSTDSNDRCW
jgi:L,D-transpeptidase-like protein